MQELLFPKTPTKKKRMQHPASIMHDKTSRTCYLCELAGDHSIKLELQEHHVFGGPNRKHSEEYGLKVYLCPECHLYGRHAAHRSKYTALLLHIHGQRAFEQGHTREEFVRIFGRNYIA